MKKQIWAKEIELNDYLQNGWTHVFRQDGTPMDKSYILFAYVDGPAVAEHSFLLEKEEIKDKEPTLYKKCIMSASLGTFELTGTFEHVQKFENMRIKKDEELFPKFLTMENLLLLALDCGLSVKKMEI